MTEIPLTEFYFLRHGETNWNLEHRAMGSQDIPLNDRGESQALNIAPLLAKVDIGRIVTSPLLRAKKTAAIIHQYLELDNKIVEIAELQEVCFGEKEGQLRGDGSWLVAWNNGAEIKGAEKYSDFIDRVKLGLGKALKYKPLDSSLLIISHGVVFRAISEILNLPIMNIGNCEPILYRPPHAIDYPWSMCPLLPNFNIS